MSIHQGDEEYLVQMSSSSFTHVPTFFQHVVYTLHGTRWETGQTNQQPLSFCRLRCSAYNYRYVRDERKIDVRCLMSFIRRISYNKFSFPFYASVALLGVFGIQECLRPEYYTTWYSIVYLLILFFNLYHRI